MTPKEKALDKIRKLLTLAEDPAASEGEIENALKAAQTLMAKYELEADEIDLSPEDLIEDKEFDFVSKQGELKNWTWDLFHIICKSQNCELLVSKRIVLDEKNKIIWIKNKIKYQDYFRIFGTKTEVSLSKEIYLKTVIIIRNIANKRYRKYANDKVTEQLFYGLPLNLPNKSKYINDYIPGFLQGLDLKLRNNKKQILIEDTSGKYGLILVKKTDLIKSFLNEKVKKIDKVKTGKEREIDFIVFNQGVKDGQAEHSSLIE